MGFFMFGMSTLNGLHVFFQWMRKVTETTQTIITPKRVGGEQFFQGHSGHLLSAERNNQRREKWEK